MFDCYQERLHDEGDIKFIVLCISEIHTQNNFPFYLVNVMYADCCCVPPQIIFPFLFLFSYITKLLKKIYANSEVDPRNFSLDRYTYNIDVLSYNMISIPLLITHAYALAHQLTLTSFFLKKISIYYRNDALKVRPLSKLISGPNIHFGNIINT